VKKQLFQKVSGDPYNTVVTYSIIENMHKKKPLFVIFFIIIASLFIGDVGAQTTIEVSQIVVQPGQSVVISGNGPIGVSINLQISNSRGLLESFNVSVVDTGYFNLLYEVPFDAHTDIYWVKTEFEGISTETSFVVSKISSQQLAVNIKILVMNAKRQAETILIEARRHGELLPVSLRDLYTEGVSELDKASNAIQRQNYIEAYSFSKEALNKFREIVEYSYGKEFYLPVDPQNEKFEIEDDIEMLERQHAQLVTITRKMKGFGINVSLLDENLNSLHLKIEEAKRLVNEERFIEAEKVVSSTQSVIEKRISEVRQRQNSITKRLSERYQESLEKRVETYIDVFHRLESIKPVQSIIALQELQKIKEKIIEINYLIDNGQVVDAVNEMRQTEKSLKNIAEMVNGPLTSKLLKRLDTLTANLQNSSELDSKQITNEVELVKNLIRDHFLNTETQSGNNSPTANP
jgi:Mor family transcriptional regulator